MYENQSEKKDNSNWEKMTDQELLDFDVEKLYYDDRLKFREKLKSVRKRLGWQFAYTKDIWSEPMLKLFLDDHQDELNPAEMFFQEKKETLSRLNRARLTAIRAGSTENVDEELDEFFDKYWDWEIDETEEVRRYKGGEAENPISNSPAGGKIEHLDSGRHSGSLRTAYLTPESQRTENQNKILGFVDSLSEDIKVLDLGCGVGSSFVKDLQGIGKLKYFNRTNIDLDPKNIEVLKKYSETEVGVSMVADAREIPLPAQSQDLVVCNMMLADNYLNHRDQRQILNEIVRVLKNGGYLVGNIGFAENVVKEFFSKEDLAGSPIYQKK